VLSGAGVIATAPRRRPSGIGLSAARVAMRIGVTVSAGADAAAATGIVARAGLTSGAAQR
jgi:hypothetical protein